MVLQQDWDTARSCRTVSHSAQFHSRDLSKLKINRKEGLGTSRAGERPLKVMGEVLGAPSTAGPAPHLLSLATSQQRARGVAFLTVPAMAECAHVGICELFLCVVTERQAEKRFGPQDLSAFQAAISRMVSAQSRAQLGRSSSVGVGVGRGGAVRPAG